jgi:hypothetical protein
VVGNHWNEDKMLTSDYSDASLYAIPEHTNLENFPYYGWNFVGSSTPTGDLTKQY